MVVGIIMGVVLIVVIIIGYRTLAVPHKVETKGSEADMARVKSGEPMYTPPAGVVPGAPTGSASGGGGMSGGYNLKPPPN
jgi:uncharacterized membrane protein YfcA